MPGRELLSPAPSGAVSRVAPQTPQEFISPSTRRHASVMSNSPGLSTMEQENNDEAERKARRRSKLLQIQQRHLSSPATPSDRYVWPFIILFGHLIFLAYYKTITYSWLQGLSQDSEMGCPKLAIVKFWVIIIFKGVHTQYKTCIACTYISTVNMYLLIEIKHNIHELP